LNGMLPVHLSIFEKVFLEMKKIKLFYKISHKIVSFRILKKQKICNESVNSFIMHFRRYLPFLELLRVYSVPTLTWFVNSTESQQGLFLPLQ